MLVYDSFHKCIEVLAELFCAKAYLTDWAVNDVCFVKTVLNLTLSLIHI